MPKEAFLALCDRLYDSIKDEPSPWATVLFPEIQGTMIFTNHPETFSYATAQALSSDETVDRIDIRLQRSDPFEQSPN